MEFYSGFTPPAQGLFWGTAQGDRGLRLQVLTLPSLFILESTCYAHQHLERHEIRGKVHDHDTYPSRGCHHHFSEEVD
ncbi:Hypothetical protein NTJ_05614 [Nesidiocoris tenuis]|uniref:Uncharacterized protein n=1 Tax=Nesidiocoris tenuis TaxID=355587 RepID=A0ABN7API9_9HEMI|nr:Hypothetical protein NTJ_05614 [Nesidiocoris tenuis]